MPNIFKLNYYIVVAEPSDEADNSEFARIPRAVGSTIYYIYTRVLEVLIILYVNITTSIHVYKLSYLLVYMYICALLVFVLLSL